MVLVELSPEPELSTGCRKSGLVTSVFTYVGDGEFFSLGIREIPQQTRRKQLIDKGRITDQQPRRSPDSEWVVGPTANAFLGQS